MEARGGCLAKRDPAMSNLGVTLGGMRDRDQGIFLHAGIKVSRYGT